MMSRTSGGSRGKASKTVSVAGIASFVKAYLQVSKNALHRVVSARMLAYVSVLGLRD